MGCVRSVGLKDCRIYNGFIVFDEKLGKIIEKTGNMSGVSRVQNDVN